MVPVCSSNGPIPEQMKARQLLETTIADLRENKLNIGVTALAQRIKAVEYSQFLATVRFHNCLGPVLGGLAARGHMEYLKCILYHIEPGDRKDICRLTGDGKQTSLHLASLHGKIDAIRLFNKSFEKMRGDWLLLVALPDASGFTALDYAARQPSPRHESLSRALIHGLTPTEQCNLFNKSKVFRKVASARGLMQIVEQANNSSGFVPEGRDHQPLNELAPREINADDFTMQLQQMVQAAVSKETAKFEELLSQKSKDQEKKLKKHAQEHASLNTQLEKCQEELKDFQLVQVEVKELKDQLSQYEQKFQEFTSVKLSLADITNQVAKIKNGIEEMQSFMGEIHESDLLNKMEQHRAFIIHCQRWKGVSIEALALDGDEPDEEAQEVDDANPIQRALIQDVAKLEKCMKQLCERVRGEQT